MSSRRDFIRSAGAMIAAPYVLKGLSLQDAGDRASSSPVDSGQVVAPSALAVSRNRRYLVNAEIVP
ncbi:MAG: hypothetical protein P8Z30_10760, partial [Acidobacteriota bacterium]